MVTGFLANHISQTVDLIAQHGDFRLPISANHIAQIANLNENLDVSVSGTLSMYSE